MKIYEVKVFLVGDVPPGEVWMFSGFELGKCQVFKQETMMARAANLLAQIKLQEAAKMQSKIIQGRAVRRSARLREDQENRRGDN